MNKLKKACQQTIMPDHVVMSVLASLPELYIKQVEPELHKGFYYLKQNENYKELTKDFFFNTSGLTPFSELLDDILFKLRLAKITSTKDPILGDATNRFSPDEQRLIVQMSQDLLSVIT